MSAPDPFAVLLPAAAATMPVAWGAVRIPALPPDYAPSTRELTDPDPGVRFARRTIARIGDADTSELLLIDKTAPHARHDLMLVAPRAGATPDALDPASAARFWGCALNFVRFVSDPAVIERFGLDGGQLHLALNCDPHTRDRESVQASKQLHLHLIHWDASELAPLSAPQPTLATLAPHDRRQALDPATLPGARLIAERLAALPLGIPGARVVPVDPARQLAGLDPLGCTLRLPGWETLASPAFGALIARLHRCLDGLAGELLDALTGQRTPPSPWRRHRLRPVAARRAALETLDCSAASRAELAALAERLRDLAPATAARLARATPARRQQLMTLDQPSYALTLRVPARTRTATPPLAAREIELGIQPKLFCGIGGAGLLGIDALPCVRIVRGVGTLSPAQWRQRLAFQQDFARANRDQLAVAPQTLARFHGAATGWR
ncbi:MAG: hypothetical protein J7D61_08425 [Marichromatium sp.]|nr:hypothetical protein [Marichromatium sp.]